MNICVPTMQIANPYRSILRPAKNVSLGHPAQVSLCLHWTNDLLSKWHGFALLSAPDRGQTSGSSRFQSILPHEYLPQLGRGQWCGVYQQLGIMFKYFYKLKRGEKRERTFLVWGKIKSEALDYNRPPNNYPFLPNYTTIASVTVLSTVLLYS